MKMDYPYLILHYFLIVETGFCFVFMKLGVEVLGGGGGGNPKKKKKNFFFFCIIFFFFFKIFLIFFFG